MISNVVQPWGKPPTPLVPKPLRNQLGHLRVPQGLGNEIGGKLRLAEFDASLWERLDSVSDECLLMLTYFLKRYYDRFRHLRVYSSQLPSQTLESLPFSTRTRNAVLANVNKLSSPSLSFEEVMSVNSLGIKSTIEFACLVEAATANRTNLGFSANFQNSQQMEQRQELGLKISHFFEVLSAWALGEQNIKSLAEVLPAPLPEWPPEINRLWSELGEISTTKLAGSLVEQYTVSNLVSRGLKTIDERSQTIALERIFTIGKSTTLEALGKRFDLSRERVRQIEREVTSRLRCFETKEFSPVKRRAQSLREIIGCAAPCQHYSIEKGLSRAVEGFSNDDEFYLAGCLLLWLAGPYKVSQNWLLTDKGLFKQTINALLEVRDEKGVISIENVTIILNDLGIRQNHHDSWIKHLKVFHRIEEGYLCFDGSILDKAKQLIQYREKPVSAEEIVDFFGCGSVVSVRQRMIEDPRFWRINKHSEFVLAGTDGYEEYTKITSAISDELKSNGGQVSATYLAEKLSRNFGVKKESITQYMNTPQFIKDECGMVRIRDESVVRKRYDISKAADCYKTESNLWCWKVKIDQNVERGSGRIIPNAFAQLLGCDIGDRIEIPTECGPITLSWPLDSTAGATIGSLRPVMMHCNAKIGDYLFVEASIPKVTFRTLDSQEVKSNSSNIVQLALLLGQECFDSEEQAVTKIATALGVVAPHREEVLNQSYQILNSRGETKLADLIPKPNLTLDHYMEDIGRLFG